MIIKKKDNWLIGAMIAGFLIGFGFIFFQFWFLGLLGFSIFLYIILNNNNFKEIFFLSYLVGIISWFFALLMIFLQVLPINWYGIDNIFLQISVVVFSLAIAVIISGINFPLWAILIKKIYKNKIYDFITLPLFWVILEYLDGWIFYFITYGDGSFPGSHFTFGWLGYLLANDFIFLQNAAIFGIFALSFIFVFLSLLLYKAIFEKKKSYLHLLFVIFIFWLVLNVLAHKKIIFYDNGLNAKNRIKFVAVSTNKPIRLYLSKIEEKKEIKKVLNSLKNSGEKVDIVILPEETNFYGLLEDEKSFLSELKFLSFSQEYPLVIDAKTIIKEGKYNQITFYFGEKVIGRSYKQFLLPLGEYIPILYKKIFFPLIKDKKTKYVLKRVRDYKAGGNTLLKYKDNIISVRLCNEVVSPEFYSSDTRRGGGVLVNLASYSWYHGSDIVFQQMQRIAKVRAVENRRWYIQATNTNNSFVLNQYGDLMKSDNNLLFYDIPILNNKSFYNWLFWGK